MFGDVGQCSAISTNLEAFSPKLGPFRPMSGEFGHVVGDFDKVWSELDRCRAIRLISGDFGRFRARSADVWAISPISFDFNQARAMREM